MSKESDIELEFYETFFFSRNLEPYPVQEEAFAHIFAGASVLVTVPTGTGKTLMAKAGILRALRSGKTAIYTTPLRALTEEKYRELCFDFGAENVGFATGDFKVNPEARIQVLVAEILWNRIYGDRERAPADIVIMDEGHYLNDFERGYVWEQSIIGLHPDAQLIILSATIGFPQRFCQWVYVTRDVPMRLVVSRDRKVPLYHEFREQYLLETVKELYAAGDYPALVFIFSRADCFEQARLLKSCARFTTKEEQQRIAALSENVLLPTGLGPELGKFLEHGIGIHHAGVLPAYRRLVEELTAERLLKFIVTTETIAAGINLPAKRAIFPSLRKYVRSEARLLSPAEYHQMAGRAGRPQFDREGIAITLAPEEVVQEFRKEIRDEKKRGAMVDEAAIKKKYYQRKKAEARARNDVSWDPEAHAKLVAGEPAELASKTQITAEQVLAIGLPDLAAEPLPGEALLERDIDGAPSSNERQAEPEGSAGSVANAAFAGAVSVHEVNTRSEHSERRRAGGLAPPITREVEAAKNAADSGRMPTGGEQLPRSSVRREQHLDIRVVIDHLLVPDAKRRESHKRLAQITANLRAIGVVDAHGRRIAGDVIAKIRGVDGMFVHFCMTEHAFAYEDNRALVEFLVDHDAIQRVLDKKNEGERKEWIRTRLRERRRENPLVTWEDCEAEYWQEHPRVLAPIELVHQTFVSKLPHPELHGGKVFKDTWATMEVEELTFLDYVERHDLGREEGQLFSYLARVMRVARMLHEVTVIPDFARLEKAVREKLAAIDARVLEGLW